MVVKASCRVKLQLAGGECISVGVGYVVIIGGKLSAGEVDFGDDFLAVAGALRRIREIFRKGEGVSESGF